MKIRSRFLTLILAASWACTSTATEPEACRIAAAPAGGETPIDVQIERLQSALEDAEDPASALERLGWLYVQKARREFDDGYYTLAEQCARCIEWHRPDTAGALLLRGHVAHQLHQFDEAERIGRLLTRRFGRPADYGLLGDALMERGDVEGAAAAYQRMVDLKPDQHSYSRVAHLRWLRGDLDGAIEAITRAVAAGSRRDPESLAWSLTRLAQYQFQAGDLAASRLSGQAALSALDGYAPALLQQGRLFLHEGGSDEALVHLRRAADLNPLPEYLWVLSEALEASGRGEEAIAVQQQLLASGELDDPRTLSLYLSTRRENLDFAVELARRELAERRDVYTLDALAWALHQTGNHDEVQGLLDRALALGTGDARLSLHAAEIAAAGGSVLKARRWISEARRFEQTLLPSERQRLAGVASQLAAVPLPAGAD